MIRLAFFSPDHECHGFLDSFHQSREGNAAVLLVGDIQVVQGFYAVAGLFVQKHFYVDVLVLLSLDVKTFVGVESSQLQRHFLGGESQSSGFVLFDVDDELLLSFLKIDLGGENPLELGQLFFDFLGDSVEFIEVVPADFDIHRFATGRATFHFAGGEGVFL